MVMTLERPTIGLQSPDGLARNDSYMALPARLGRSGTGRSVRRYSRIG